MKNIGVLFAKDAADYLSRVQTAVEQAGMPMLLLEWSGDLERDLQQLDKLGIHLLIVQGHRSHHGFKLAREAVERLGVEPIVVSSSTEEYPPSLPILQLSPGMASFVPRLQTAITNGTQFGQREVADAFDKDIQALERAAAALREVKERYVGHTRRILTRQKSFSCDPD